MHALVARRELPQHRADLPARESAAARTAAGRAHQAAPARPLGHVARAEPRLRAPEPPHHASTTRTSSTWPGPATAGRRWSRTCISKARTRSTFPPSRRTSRGMRRLFRQFSTPGGIPSHVSAPTPGSIHEGGELGYVLVHAFGAAFDNPDLIVAAVVGDGEAETGPLEGSWKGVKFLNPARDGAVLPILHLNGYKISGPTVLGRETDETIAAFLQGHGYDAHFVDGDDPMTVHRQFAAALETRLPAHPRDPGRRARATAFSQRPVWPAIVLRTPKGWTGPKVVDGVPIEGHVPRPPGAALRRAREPRAPEDARGVDAQLQAGGAVRRRRSLARRVCDTVAARRAAHGRQPARQRRRAQRAARSARLRRLRGGGAEAGDRAASSRPAGSASSCATSSRRNARQANFRLFCPDETNSNRLGAVFEATNRCFVGHAARHRRSRLARRPRHGGAERAQLPRLARGLRAHRTARPLRHLRGVRHGGRLDGDAARQVARALPAHPVAQAGPVAQLPAHLDVLAQRSQRLQPSGAGLHRQHRQQEADRRARLPAARRELACCRSPTTACAAATTST